MELYHVKRLYFLTQLGALAVLHVMYQVSCRICLPSLSLSIVSFEQIRIYSKACHANYLPYEIVRRIFICNWSCPSTQRRREISDKLFKNISDNDCHRLHQLLRNKNNAVANLRRKDTLIVPKIKH